MRAAQGPALFHDLEGLLDAAPLDLGVTDWVRVDAEAVTAFRRSTGTGVTQPGGAGAEVPPLMLLALTNRFLPELMQVPAATSGVNYGAEMARFGPAARVGDQVRARARLESATAVAGAVQTTVEIRVEVGGRGEPACVIRSVSRWLR